MIEKTNACTIAFIKARIPWFFNVGRNLSIGKKKTEDCENLFFKALSNRFWLTSKSCFWFNKVVHDRHSIK